MHDDMILWYMHDDNMILVIWWHIKEMKKKDEEQGGNRNIFEYAKLLVKIEALSKSLNGIKIELDKCVNNG